MPGIAGIIAADINPAHGAALDRMVDAMCHEPFYATGSCSIKPERVHLGWVAHQGSFSDCMPLWNETKDICLIFSGEDFSPSGERDQLRAKGHAFNLADASYLVHRYEEIGSDFLLQINGWFSGVLVDLKKHKVTVFNDRYGVNRVFFHQSADAFYFASEAKALLRVVPSLRKLDETSLSEFLTCGCVLQNRTLFSGVEAMPGGSAWSFSLSHEPRKERYFIPSVWEALPSISPEDYYERLQEIWSRILPGYFAGNDKVGLSLTGGVDSRMILAWAPRTPGTLPCYTWGGSYRDCADVTLSREIARLCQQPHQTIEVGREFLSQFPDIVDKAVYISEGTMDATGSIDLFVQRKARQITPVRIGGVYGGEILRRLVMFKPTPPGLDLFEPAISDKITRAADTYRAERAGHKLTFTAFRQAPWSMTSKFAIERSQLMFRTPYFDNELVQLVYQAPASLAEDNNLSLRLVSDGNPVLKDLKTDRGVTHNSLPVFSALRHQWHEFTFKAEYAYDYGMPQKLAKVDHALSALHIERLFLGRHKFHHFRVWYRDQLSGFLKDVLLDSRALNRPYLRRSRLETMIKGHTRGTSNHTLEIHRLLAVELIQRQLIDKS